MKTLQERLRYMHNGTGLAHLQEAADKIDELEFKLKVALESYRCECSSNDACRFARERDSLAQQVRIEQLYNQERADRLDSLKAELAGLRKANKELWKQRFEDLDKHGELQKDAERYRAVRNQDCAITGMPHGAFDQAIDAAIAAEDAVNKSRPVVIEGGQE